MKKVAALILNRNLPQVTDELGEWIIRHHAPLVDLYVVENGSDADKYSRYANIILAESLGPAGGINEGVRQLTARGYEYVWVNYNDACYEQPSFLPAALDTLNQDRAVALVLPYWPDNTWLFGRRGRHDLVTFCAILCFVVRCSALEKIAHDPRFRFEPLWDSSNFTNHDNILATLLALYENQLCAVTDQRFTVTELTAPADNVSKTARGFSAEEWKKTKGPADVEAWYQRAFPELSGTYKEKRAVTIKRIEQLIQQHRLGSVSPMRNKVKSLIRRSLNLSRRLARRPAPPTGTTSMVETRLRHALRQRVSTLLAIGPMSKNCVDATIELAYKYPAPLMLIASRRQIEAAELGSGYVNQWSTEAFVRYVRDRDPKRKVILARDHGGPWQNTDEIARNMPAAAAMASAKRSYDTDIAVGLDILHLDPSIDPHQPQPSPEVILERLFELYEHCMRVAAKHRRQLILEVGAEEQSSQRQTIEELQTFLTRIRAFCLARNFPQPFFAVVQSGTKVKETRNIGSLGFGRPGESDGATAGISQLVETCRQFGVYIKEHNADYLSDEILHLHPRLGIHAANVAPEFGVVETRKIIELCDYYGLSPEKEDFLRLAYESRKWEKWLTENSTATDFDKAVMAGHYVFAHPSFVTIKERLAARCSVAGTVLNHLLRQAVTKAIMRYMTAFNLL